MANEGKYGIITASKKQFHPGEPVFLLRATDPLAPFAVRALSRAALSLARAVVAGVDAVSTRR